MLQGKRFAVEYRCPYCLTISTVRKTVMNHIVEDHAAILTMVEQEGERSASSRMFNLSRAGVRIVDENRVDQHIKELAGDLTPRLIKRVRKVVYRCLVEALVMVGTEDEVAPNSFKRFKDVFQSLLK